MRPEIALTNAGVLVDVVGIGYDEYTPEQRDQVTTAFPRGDFKNEFLQIQTCSALKKPQTTFGTVNFDYIEDHDPTFHKPNACTHIRDTPWQSRPSAQGVPPRVHGDGAAGGATLAFGC